MHYQSLSEPGQVRKLTSLLHKGTGAVVKKKPRLVVRTYCCHVLPSCECRGKLPFSLTVEISPGLFIDLAFGIQNWFHYAHQQSGVLCSPDVIALHFFIDFIFCEVRSQRAFFSNLKLLISVEKPYLSYSLH